MSERDEMAAPEAESDNYKRGWADGMAGKDPDFESLALGANRLNDYERGYIDSGRAERGQ